MCCVRSQMSLHPCFCQESCLKSHSSTASNTLASKKTHLARHCSKCSRKRMSILPRAYKVTLYAHTRQAIGPQRTKARKLTTPLYTRMYRQLCVSVSGLVGMRSVQRDDYVDRVTQSDRTGSLEQPWNAEVRDRNSIKQDFSLKLDRRRYRRHHPMVSAPRTC